MPLHSLKADIEVCVIGSASPSCHWHPRCNSKKLSTLAPCDELPSLGQPAPLKGSGAAGIPDLEGATNAHYLVCNQLSLQPMHIRAVTCHGPHCLLSIETRTLWANANLQGSPVRTGARTLPPVQQPCAALCGWTSLHSSLFPPRFCSLEELY